MAAPPERAFEAALAVTVGELPLSVTLLTLRGLLGFLKQRRLPHWGGSTKRFLDQLVRTPPFMTLIEPYDGYAAFGYVGRPWKPAAEAGDVSAADFASFDEPGWAKVVMDLTASPAYDGSLLRTETRIHLTDEHARRAFGRYWAVVKFGSNAVRGEWLRAARRRAESET